jgi:hypothetical protein
VNVSIFLIRKQQHTAFESPGSTQQQLGRQDTVTLLSSPFAALQSGSVAITTASF